MVLVIDKKPLEGVWWKYALGLAVLQLFCWVILGYKVVPSYSLLYAFRASYVVYGTFILFAVLPFVFGRLQLKRLMWCGLIGFVIGDMAYFLLGLYEPTRRIPLLPFIAFTQLAVSMTSLGILIELGRYVYIKVFEE